MAVASNPPAGSQETVVVEVNETIGGKLYSFTITETFSVPAAPASGATSTNAAASTSSTAANTKTSSLPSNLSTLGASNAASVTVAQLQSLSATQFAQLGAAFLSALSATQTAAISIAQLDAIPATTIPNLSIGFLNQLSATQLAGLTKAEVQALTSTQIAGLSSPLFASLNLANLTSAQLAGFTAAEIGALSVANFDKYVATNLSAFNSAALVGVTAAQLASLNQTQIAGLTAAEVSAMGSSAGSFVSDYRAVLKDLATQAPGGSLTFAGAEALLQEVAAGGMTAGKFAALKAIAGDLNAGGSNSITTTAMVQQLFDDVVLGNADNAVWNGGASTATALGNLSATSTATQANELIGKWFLGSDDPSLAGAGAPVSYKSEPGTLFAATGPLFTDVNQGDTGDCYFESALGETALQDPNLIRNMITSDGNGVYTVDFQLNGANDYVTVNSDIAMLGGGYHFGDGSTVAYDHAGTNGAIWSEIVEKAFVEFSAQLDGVNSYQNISGGWDNGLEAITGQSVSDYYASQYASATAQKSLISLLGNAFSAKEDVIMNDAGANSSLNLVGSHMYAVIGVNAAAGTVTLDNPWNGSGAGDGLKMQFTDSLSSLISAGVTFHVANGAPAVA